MIAEPPADQGVRSLTSSENVSSADLSRGPSAEAAALTPSTSARSFWPSTLWLTSSASIMLTGMSSMAIVSISCRTP